MLYICISTKRYSFLELTKVVAGADDVGSKLDEVGVKITGAGGKGKYVWPWDNMALGIDCWCDQRGWETRQKRNSQGVPNVLYVILSGILWEIKLQLGYKTLLSLGWLG